MVAFRRDADHILAEPEGVADLRGRGEEGNDPHAARPSDTPRPLKALFKRTRRRCPGWMTEDSANAHSLSHLKAGNSNLQKGEEVEVYPTVFCRGSNGLELAVTIASSMTDCPPFIASIA